MDKAYDTEGVHVEDCLVEAEGKDYRSFAVEGKPDDVKRFLATHPVGQKLYAQATADVGAILHGYPGFVLSVQVFKGPSGGSRPPQGTRRWASKRFREAGAGQSIQPFPRCRHL